MIKQTIMTIAFIAGLGISSADNTAAVWVFPRASLPAGDSSPFLHEWKLKDGRHLKGTADGRVAEGIVLKNTRGVKATLPEGSLVNEDLVRFKFWEGASNPVRLPRLHLVYQYMTSTRGAFEVIVSTEGNLGRVDFPGEHSTLIYDMADGAFLRIIAFIKEDGNLGKPIIYWGRFEQRYLLPYKTSVDFEEIAWKHFLEKGVERASNSTWTQYPARHMHFPGNGWQGNVNNLKLDYVLVNDLTALAALYQFLAAPGLKRESVSLFRHKRDVSCHDDFEMHMSYFSKAGMLPIRMRWTNAEQQHDNSAESKSTQGPFSIELIRASIPESWPVDHFSIPVKTRTMTPGAVEMED